MRENQKPIYLTVDEAIAVNRFAAHSPHPLVGAFFEGEPENPAMRALLDSIGGDEDLEPLRLRLAKAGFTSEDKMPNVVAGSVKKRPKDRSIDPVARTSIDGGIVKPGHVGTIYQAYNAHYYGRAKAETLTLDERGCVISRRALSKLRNDECGAAYAYEQLIASGAPERRLFEDGPAYVARALRDGPFRKVRHPGNHAYGWTLHRGVEHTLPAAKYPKMDRRAT